MRATELDLLEGPGGWVQASLRTEPTRWLFVRFAPAEGGAWAWTGELCLPPDTPPDALRDLAGPLRRVVLAVAASENLQRRLAARRRERVPHLNSADFWGAFSGYVVPALKLERPPGRRFPKSFYESVAETYTAAVERGLDPRSAIAEAAGVSRDVAGRWVKVARNTYGLLPKTEPGKVRA